MQASSSEVLLRHMPRKGPLDILGKHVTNGDTLLANIASHSPRTSSGGVRDGSAPRRSPCVHRSSSAQLPANLAASVVLNLVPSEDKRSSDGSLLMVPHRPAVLPKYQPGKEVITVAIPVQDVENVRVDR